MADPTIGSGVPLGGAAAAPSFDYASLDDGALLDRTTKKRDEWARGREPIVRAAYMNILYYRSMQWVTFDPKMGRIRPAILKPGTPTPVTNKFACLDGDTTIPCLDGTLPTIRELAARQTMPWLFGFDREQMRVVPVLAERVWKTGERECVRVEFDEGTSVVCTPDHKFLTWGRGYVEAQDLKPGESIVPCIPGGDRYPAILQPADGKFEHIHRMVARDFYGPIPKGHHVHHRDGTVDNNQPENLEVLSASAHMSLTRREAYARGELLGTRSPEHPARMRALWGDAGYRAKQAKSRRASWEKDPARREKVRQESAARRDPGTGRLANHRVSAVVPVGAREVYDICTPRTSNFGIGAGVFVHNSTMDAVISVFARVEPRLNFRPGNPEEPEDRATADVATRAMGTIEDEVHVRYVRQMLAPWVGLTGQAWLENGYDADPVHGSVAMEVDKCAGPECADHMQPQGLGQCINCGQPTLPETIQMPRGKMYTEVCSIFEMFFDPSVTDWYKQTEYIREKSLPLDRAKDMYPDFADRIVPNVTGGPDELYGESLPLLGPALTAGPNPRQMQQQRPQANKVTEQRYYSLPTREYPEGLLVIVLSKSLVVYKGPLRTTALQADGSRRGFLPHVHFPQKLVPGTAFAKTVADDIRLKQAQRNRWESIVEACGMRVGMPIWLRPRGSNASTLTGEPGQVVDYNAAPGGTGQLKPERVQGQGIPLAYIQMIQQIDKDFEELAATFDVIKGARPEGVSAGIALQILQERGMSRYGPLFILWEQAWAEWARQMIEIFREYATEERLLKIKGRNGQWEVQKFVGADLQGSVDVIPEAGSSMPHSTLTDRAEIEQLVSQGFLDRTDPDVRFKVLEMYSKAYMVPNLEADTKNAIRENEAFEALAQNPEFQHPLSSVALQNLQTIDYPTIVAELASQGIKIPKVMAAIDDHSVHSRELGQWAKSETFQRLPEAVQIIAAKHKEYHDQIRLQQSQALMHPLPKVSVALKGMLDPQQVAEYAGSGVPAGAGGGAPGPQGPHPMPLAFGQAPPAQIHVMNTSSSPERMAGDFHEMGHDVAAGNQG